MPLYFEGITSSSIRPVIFFFQPLIYLKCDRTDLDHIQHAVKARPPVRLIRIWIFLTVSRPAVTQLAVSVRSQEISGYVFCLVSVFLIAFQQIFFNKLIFCKPHILCIPGEIFFRDAAPVHLATVSASAAVISCKQLFVQPVKLFVQFPFISIPFQINAEFIIFISFFFASYFIFLGAIISIPLFVILLISRLTHKSCPQISDNVSNYIFFFQDSRISILKTLPSAFHPS